MATSGLTSKQVEALASESNIPPRSRMEEICNDLELEIDLANISTIDLHRYLSKECTQLFEELKKFKHGIKSDLYPSLNSLESSQIPNVEQYLLLVLLELELG